MNSHSNPSDINIVIDPKKFINRPNLSVEHTNKKWFLNLTNSVIPSEVSRLL